LRRALVAELVRSLTPPEEVMRLIESRITDQVQPQHQDKLRQDMLAELDHLDISRMGALTRTRTGSAGAQEQSKCPPRKGTPFEKLHLPDFRGAS
jgi:hypothetical protein